MRPLTKREQAAATVAAIRAKYPNPEKRGEEGSWCSRDGMRYCVGGAYALFQRRHIPGFKTAAYTHNIQFAGVESLVLANEAGDFERAWQLLEDILAA